MMKAKRIDGEDILNFRCAQGISQKALGQTLGVTGNQVYNWESGRRSVCVHTQRLLRAYMRYPDFFREILAEEGFE
jgi:DNA-binding transcriptional regulator YiaG